MLYYFYEQMKKFFLFLIDGVILYASLALTMAVRYGASSNIQLNQHLPPFGFIFALWLMIFYVAGLYDIDSAKNDDQFFSTFFYGVLTNLAFSLAFFYLIPFFGITPKTNLLIFTGIAGIIQFAWHFYFNKLIARKGQRNNMLIIGKNQQSEELYDYLLSNPQLGYNAVGIVDISNESAYDILEKLIAQKKIKTLVLSPSTYQIPRIVGTFYRLLSFKINFYNLAEFYERTTGKVPLGTINQAWFLQNLSEGSKREYEIVKRIFDFVFGLVIGGISLIIYPFIMLAIKLDSTGPIFFRQTRMGRAGRPFTLIKFRNMITDSKDGSAEGASGPVWASENDSRVTRVGKFIRKTRIDELPQIWNILRGDMSFIGPRPERPEFSGKLKEQVPFYEERHLVKPGLTGWAQVKYKLDFKGGMTVSDTTEKVQHDLYYVKNRSMFLDIEIILKTIKIILKKVF